MSVNKLLSFWRADSTIATSIEAWRDIPERIAQVLPIPEQIHPRLVEALRQQGIHQLYTHQVIAWNHIQSGKNIVVVTGTASGKTLCYNLPVLDRLLRQPEAHALYLFPTKALAQDQATSLQNLIDNLTSSDNSTPDLSPTTPSALLHTLKPAIYDGDTPSHYRSAIRAKARLLYTNPDMLHIGILPHHTDWVQLFRQLLYVIIDEAHVYRGVFGSHVANLLRRMRRIARSYGSNPQFILTSATMANPKDFSERLIEENVVLVEEDGAARGAKKFLIYNPPIVNRDLGLRRSALHESVRLASDLLTYGVQTIIFGRSRRTVELILTYLRNEDLHRDPKGFPKPIGSDLVSSIETKNIVRGYRSGYLPEQRREIERGLRAGQIRAVVATNALELGVDIGGMGASLMVGFPGTIAATRQQAGRAGRGQDTSLAILVATADPLDQFLASHPDYLFDRSPEQALINPDNPLILLDHLRCAAFELPFTQGECFGAVEWNKLEEYLDFLHRQGVLHTSGNRYFWMSDQYPAQSISLRTASANTVILQTLEEDHPVMIGKVDQASAHWMVHPQAIYLHEGCTYLVEDLDLQQNVARLHRQETDYYTIPRNETTVQLLEKYAEEEVTGGTKAHGEIQVTTQVTGFRKIKWYTHEQLGLEEIEMPPTELLTTGYWLSLSANTVERLREDNLWRNDPINYGPNWNTQRQAARQRDRYLCQACGAPEQGRSHEVHHKIPFRTFPSFEQANRLENLVTLCSTCHQRVETVVRVHSGLAGLAFTLIHLAPFFLMCDTGDLGVHADPQSPFADGNPTVLIYDQVPAGIGLSQRLFELHPELIARAHELVSACECTDGCPSCVGPGGESGLGGKREALAILSLLIADC
jgi:DEAD/DEAH box helicase domain-containing protein